MAAARTWRGKNTNRDAPDWAPLCHLVGEEVVGAFMWMFEVELSDGTRLQAYKHVDTRRYIHLASDGSAFANQSPDRYVRVVAVDVLAQVFASLPGLAGVTAEQVEASRRALERVRRHERAESSRCGTDGC